MKKNVLLFLLPSLLIISLSSFIPLITVINYSLHILFAGSIPKFVGLQNYIDALHNDAFLSAILRQLKFTIEILIIEIPLGLSLALLMPKKGPLVGFIFVLLGIPLLVPWNVVGIMWRILVRSDIGIIPLFFHKLGLNYNIAHYDVDAWWTVVFMDVWHWTPLVILLSYAGLRAIPQEFYQAARIDGASKWSTFRYVTLPKLRAVLIIAVLLRAMDSFKIYDEVFLLTHGGPGNTTELLSLYTSRQVIGGFNMGFSSAISLIYFYVVLVLCYLLYTSMKKMGVK